MRRRGFLALPFLGLLARAASRVKALVLRKTATVGVGADFRTLAEALDNVEAGGTVYVMPGHVETIREPLILAGGRSVIGGSANSRPVFRWKP